MASGTPSSKSRSGRRRSPTACARCSAAARSLCAMSSATEPTVLWEPTDERRERAAITRYARWLEETRDLRLPGYHDLWRWSVEDLEGFWGSIWEFSAI